MILNPLFAKILIVIIYLGIIFLFAFLWKKMKFKAVAGGTIGFFVGIVPAAILVVMSTGLLVIDSEDSYTEYWVYGSPTYTTAEGEEITIENEIAQWTLINDSDVDMVIEHVVYGMDAKIPDDIFLDPGEATILESKLNYFFENEPPNEISTQSSSNSVYVKWLRTVEDYEGDYGY